MQIVRLFRRGADQQGIEECDRLILQRGYGIMGDRYAIPGSPRQVLLVGTPSLERFELNPGHLRENILVNESVETLTSGQTLQIGHMSLVRLTFLCEPCARLEGLQPGLAKRIRGQRGMLGMVVRDGVVQVGDRLVIAPYSFPKIPETARERFEEFVCRIPKGCVVRTADLLLALGLSASYYRVIPTFLKKSPIHLPVHRIVTINGGLMTHHLPHQREALEMEGVSFEGDRVSEGYSWNPLDFHDLGEL